jgi:hypothetical protein
MKFYLWILAAVVLFILLCVAWQNGYDFCQSGEVLPNIA